MSESEDSHDYVYSSDFDDVDELNLLVDPSNSALRLSSKSGIKMLSLEEMYKTVANYLSGISGMLQISTACVRVLLSHLEGNEADLVESCFSDRRPQLFKACKLQHLIQPLEINSKNWLCFICMDEEHSQGFSPDLCCHFICNDCWQHYIMSVLSDRLSESCTIICPVVDCPVILDDNDVINLLSSPSKIHIFKQEICRSFCKYNRFFKPCSDASCQMFFKTNQISPVRVVCICGAEFCFKCASEQHEPIDCSLLQLWTARSKIHMQDLDWLKANSKECPKCKTWISKSGGCNHVRCPTPTCHFDFCWTCLECYDSHQTVEAFSCHRLDQAESPSSQSQETDRWKFYYSKYQNYRDLVKASGQYNSIIASNFKNRNQRLSAVEEQNFLKLLQRLIFCEQCLMNSFIFSCVTKSDNNLFGIFTSNQRFLETTVKQTMEIIDHFITNSSIKSFDLSESLNKKISLCEERRQTITSVIQEGYTRNIWTFYEGWQHRFCL